MGNLNLIWENTVAGQSGSGQELMGSVERLIQSCAVPMFVIDGEHRVILWNRACEALILQ